MNNRRRLQLLEALATAQEAAARAMLLALEEDDGDPPNVIRDAEKTGPRSPYSGQRTIAHLRRLLADASTSVERARIRTLARRLAVQGHLTDGDIASLEET